MKQLSEQLPDLFMDIELPWFCVPRGCIGAALLLDSTSCEQEVDSDVSYTKSCLWLIVWNVQWFASLDQRGVLNGLKKKKKKVEMNPCVI